MKATTCQNECCCNCKHQVKINCHPLNGRQRQFGFLEDKIKIGQGSINQQLAWGCAAFYENPELSGDNERVIIYSDRQHGMCEMHENKQ